MIITPNLPELKRLNMWVQAQNKLEPGARRWDQHNWAMQREETPMCQTAYCVAGMAITRAGHVLINEIFEVTCGSSCRCTWKDSRLMLDGDEVDAYDISTRAAEILGIGQVTADELFAASNNAEGVDRYIRGIFLDAGVDYDAVEPAPALEIEIKAAEAVRPQLLPKLINV